MSQRSNKVSFPFLFFFCEIVGMKMLTEMLCKSEWTCFLILSATTVPRLPFFLTASSVISVEKFPSLTQRYDYVKTEEAYCTTLLKVIELMSYLESLPQIIQHLRKHYISSIPSPYASHQSPVARFYNTSLSSSRLLDNLQLRNAFIRCGWRWTFKWKT